ncbi:MAG: hypothetical protein RAP03_07895, partial [Candidatus Electryonea clarkiae]|nr:hypothetical protein [Candidatus Electryonea clarkiae]
MMKNFIILALLISSYTTLAFADHRITQGPDIGEIYFIGPTATGEGIYHSTDFGKTAICVDSTIDAMSICADRSSDVLYYVTMGEALYISYDSGLQGSWLFRNGGVKLQINSGRSEGEIYSSFSKHSEDYGVNFISHNAYGFFGSRLDSEIDNEDNIGYIVVNNYPIIDSLWLLITHDNFDSLEIQNVYNVDKFPIRYIRRGTVYGELFSIAGEPSSIRHSDDYGESWHVTNTLNSGGSYYDFVG